jgi:hypothetical protein
MFNILFGMLFGILFLALTVYYIVTLLKLSYLIFEMAVGGIKLSIANRSVQLKESVLNTQ